MADGFLESSAMPADRFDGSRAVTARSVQLSVLFLSGRTSGGVLSYVSNRVRAAVKGVVFLASLVWDRVKVQSINKTRFSILSLLIRLRGEFSTSEL